MCIRVCDLYMCKHNRHNHHMYICLHVLHMQALSERMIKWLSTVAMTRKNWTAGGGMRSAKCEKLLNFLWTFEFYIMYTCSDQIRSVAQSCPTIHDPMNRSMPGLPFHHQLPEFTQTHVQQVGDAIQPSHPLSSPSPPAPNPSQHQSLFQWVNSSHVVAKVLEFQL